MSPVWNMLWRSRVFEERLWSIFIFSLSFFGPLFSKYLRPVLSTRVQYIESCLAGCRPDYIIESMEILFFSFSIATMQFAHIMERVNNSLSSEVSIPRKHYNLSNCMKHFITGMGFRSGQASTLDRCVQETRPFRRLVLATFLEVFLIDTTVNCI